MHCRSDGRRPPSRTYSGIPISKEFEGTTETSTTPKILRENNRGRRSQSHGHRVGAGLSWKDLHPQVARNFELRQYQLQMSIHPTAIVDPKSKIHPSCTIGPYCVVGPDVQLGEGCRVASHVAIEGPAKIGVDNGLFPFTSIGLGPQDTTYARQPTRLEIGDHNVIREFVTINRGTVKGGGCTRVGDHNLIMAYTHIPHGCQLGSHI